MRTSEKIPAGVVICPVCRQYGYELSDAPGRTLIFHDRRFPCRAPEGYRRQAHSPVCATQVPDAPGRTPCNCGYRTDRALNATATKEIAE